MPLPSTAVTPCSRSADSNVGYTRLFGTGRAEMMLIVPLILGSRMKLRPVISDTALTTDSMSALTKLRVTVSSCARAGGTRPSQAQATASAAPASARRRDTRRLASPTPGAD